MPVTIQFRIYCLPDSCPKTQCKGRECRMGLLISDTLLQIRLELQSCRKLRKKTKFLYLQRTVGTSHAYKVSCVTPQAVLCVLWKSELLKVKYYLLVCNAGSSPTCRRNYCFTWPLLLAGYMLSLLFALKMDAACSSIVGELLPDYTAVISQKMVYSS
jgi:hypothetical protein